MTAPLVLAAVVAGVAAVAGGGLLLRRRYVAVSVSGPSMEPTLRHGDRVIVRRLRLDRVRAGQIVVFRQPPPWRGVDGWADGRRLPETGFWTTGTPRAVRHGRWTIKRAVAVPGDPLPPELAEHAARLGPTVPAGSLAVLGDNRARSVDSRRFGFVLADEILGVLTHPSRPA